jgi:endonuclease/exonuclease/phosphatase family metal-dependent hydrolase
MKSLLSAFILLTSLSANAALTIGAYNIRNFDYDVRYRIKTNKVELATLIKGLNVDVLSVEEINNSAEFEKFVETKLPGYGVEISRCGGEHGQHLGFIYNKTKVDLLSFNEDLSISEPGRPGACDSGSRPMAIGLFQAKTSKQRFYGMTVHLKSGSEASSRNKRTKQYQIIKKIITELKTNSGVKDFYVAGDFNTTEYLSRGTDYKELTTVVKGLGMEDLASNLKCSAYWWGGSDDGIEDPSLLDHLLVTPGLVKMGNPKVQVGGHCEKVSCRQASLKDLGVSYESVSDHCPVTATIQ